jgi:hypothetical protein
VTGVVAVAFSGDLLIGLILGSFLGFLVGPLIRAWLSWREWVSASRAAGAVASRAADPDPDRDTDVFADLVNRIDAGAWPVLDDPEIGNASLPGTRRDAS